MSARTWALFIPACALAVSATWYAFELLRADRSILLAFASANRAEVNQTVEHGRRAVESFDPTGTYEFLFARALALGVNRLPASSDRRSGQSHRSAVQKAER